MRKKSVLTIVEQAIVLIPEFEHVVRKLEQQVTLCGQSKSTLQKYIRRIPLFVVYFGKLPEQIDPEEIDEYLATITRDPRSPSRSSFKQMVYGLHYYYRPLSMNKDAIALPSIKRDNKLPVVLNHQECKALFHAPDLLKHRVVLTLMYSAGLRAREVSRLKLSDIDSSLMMIHIRQSNYNKDRNVPLLPAILIGLRKYYYACRPVDNLFNSNTPGSPLSVRSMQWALREAVKKCKLQKGIPLHTLRHTYATHLLEYGMDIVTIKELLGHERIETAMVYMHVAKPNRTLLMNLFQ